MKYYQFPCKCSFPILEESPDPSILPLLDFDLEKISENCPATFKLISDGKTKGIFQLETGLGKSYSRKLKPETIQHLAGLGAALRPSCLESKDENGISITSHYCKRKNGEEEVKSYHPAIDEILSSTFNCLLFQEQSIAIAKKIAGFSLVEADLLRKCIVKETMFLSKQRGWISIKTLLATSYDKDDFLVMDEKGKQNWNKIKKIWPTGKQYTYSVKSSTGFFVKATQYHQFLTDNGWKARKRLAIGKDHLVVCREVEYDGEDKLSLPQCMVIAGLATEGFFPIGKGGTFVNYDSGMMNTFLTNASLCLNKPVKQSPDKRVAYINLANKQQIHEWGMSYGLSATKELPEKMLGSTKETMRHFLSFMLAAEGGITTSGGVFEFSSKSFKMIMQVKLMLLRFAIRSNLYCCKAKGYLDNYYKLSVTNIPDQKKMLSELTLYWPDYKRKAFISAINLKDDSLGFSTDIIPQSLIKKLLNQYPFAVSHESGRIYHCDLTRFGFFRMAEKTKDKYWIEMANGRQQFDNIKAIEDRIKESEVFDFCMENENLPYIVANGIVIHNSIGKKIPEEMAKCKKMFLEGAAKAGILTKEQSEEVFSWIEKSQRYAFNLSHSIAYGYIGYLTAYIKAHFPLAFFGNWLKCAHMKADPQTEIAELIEDAKLFNIEIEPPDLRSLSPSFYTDRKKIYFGLGDIKGIGDKQIEKILEVFKGETFKDLSWFQFLVKYGKSVTTNILEKLIRSGALRFLDEDRQKKIYDLKIWSDLTKTEMKWFGEKAKEFPNLLSTLKAGAIVKKHGGACHSTKRVGILRSQIQLMEHPPTQIKDTCQEIAYDEEDLLGISLTFSKIDSCDLSVVNTTCKDFLVGKTGFMVIGAEIKTAREYKTKNGKMMCFLTISDASAPLDVVCFEKQWLQYKDLLFEGNLVIIQLERTKMDTASITKAWQAYNQL